MQSGNAFTAGVDEAAEAIRILFPATPLQLNEHLSKRWGARVYLKREDLSPVRSYKIRGASTSSARRWRSKQPCAPSSAPRPAITPRASPLSAGISASRASSTCGGRHRSRRSTRPHVRRALHHLPPRRRYLRQVLPRRAGACGGQRRRHGAAFDHDDIIEGQASVAARSSNSCRRGKTIDRLVMPVGGGGLSAGLTGYLAGHVAPRPSVCRAHRRAEPEAQPGGRRDRHPAARRQFRRWRGGGAHRHDQFRSAAGLSGQPGHAAAENAICAMMIEMLNVEGVVLEPAGALALTALDMLGREKLEGRPSSPSSPAAISTSSGCPTSRSAPMRYCGAEEIFHPAHAAAPRRAERLPACRRGRTTLPASNI